jgi:isopentenyl phosphate kinase
LIILFSHHQAKKFRLNEGFTDTDDYEKCCWGVCDTRRSLGRLQQYLLDAFLRLQIPVVGISPFDFLISDQFELINENFNHLCQHLELLLSKGYVPLLHGDVLIDKTKHWRIFSGDDLLLKLAEYFQVRQCVFLTSVPGILRSDGSVIEEFYVDESKIDELDNPSTIIDVTGSMKNKVMIACDIIKKLNKCQVFILQGVSQNAKELLTSTIIDDKKFVLNGSTTILKR